MMLYLHNRISVWFKFLYNLIFVRTTLLDYLERQFKKQWLYVSYYAKGLPGSSVGKESACSAGDLGLIPGLGRSLEKGNGNPLQCSCLENSMDRGAWQLQRTGHDRVTNTLSSTKLFMGL